MCVGDKASTVICQGKKSLQMKHSEVVIIIHQSKHVSDDTLCLYLQFLPEEVKLQEEQEYHLNQFLSKSIDLYHHHALCSINF